jgi:polyhydroxybutyrate depolymerase
MRLSRWMLLASLASLAAPILGGCGGDGDDEENPDTGRTATCNSDIVGEDGGEVVSVRPYGLVVPDDHDADSPAPLVVLLHGYTATGAIQLAYFGLEAVAGDRGVLIAYPDGTADGVGNQFWNATDACCDLGGSGVDDVGYLTAVVDDVAERCTVDPDRIYMVGHSNGGFMSHRMACDRADRVAAIASLAGANWADPEQCEPSEPVSVLQVHGDADGTILYGGGGIGENGYPSAADTVASWAASNGCEGELEATDVRLDLDSAMADDETRVDRYADCPDGAAVELWTIEGGGHVPGLVQPAWPEAVLDFLLAHPRE